MRIPKKYTYHKPHSTKMDNHHALQSMINDVREQRGVDFIEEIYSTKSQASRLIGFIVHKSNQVALSVQSSDGKKNEFTVEFFSNFETAELAPIKEELFSLQKIPQSHYLYRCFRRHIGDVLRQFTTNHERLK